MKKLSKHEKELVKEFLSKMTVKFIDGSGKEITFEQWKELRKKGNTNQEDDKKEQK